MEENKEYTQDELSIIFSTFKPCPVCHTIKNKTCYFASRNECKTCWNIYQVNRKRRIRAEKKCKEELLKNYLFIN